ncbi:MAG: hypothetical protein RLZZ450_2529 [Pseudomonadota bacterium]|jgi:hypothetical protein
MGYIYCYLKFFEQERYARDFLQGNLRMNALGFFKDLENAGDGRNDRFEGPHSWLQPAQLGEIQIGDICIPASELAGATVVQYHNLNAVNVLCLYTMTPDGFGSLTDATLEAFRQHMRVPQSSIDMGPYAVLVHKPQTFHDRIVAAARKEGCTLSSGLVEYFDADIFSGALPNPLFAKRNEFKAQREYRFALDRRDASVEPYTLKVGPLHDTCTLVDSSKINEQLTFNLPR